MGVGISNCKAIDVYQDPYNITLPTAIPRSKHRFSSDHRSEGPTDGLIRRHFNIRISEQVEWQPDSVSGEGTGRDQLEAW